MVVAATATLLGPGCGSDGSGGAAGPPVSGSCTIHAEFSYGGDSVSEYAYCFEMTGMSSTQIQQFSLSCTGASTDADAGITQTAVFSRLACSRDNSVGGCRLKQGAQTITSWYYADSAYTTSTVEQACTAGGGTFISSSGAVHTVSDAGTDSSSTF
jgi:hypothetical protein